MQFTAFVVRSHRLSLQLARGAAQGFKPTKPIEFVVHTGPGGGSDVLARAIAADDGEGEADAGAHAGRQQDRRRRRVAAMAYLVEKKGDTHTIAVFTGVWFTNPIMSAEAKVTLKDLTPIVRLVLEPAVVAVKADAPYKTLEGLHRRGEAEPRAAQAVGRLDHAAATASCASC